MKNYLYVFYNTLSKRYGNVVCFPSDGFCVNQYVSQASENDLKYTEICKIGSIDIETGVLEPCNPSRLDLNMLNGLPVSESK